MTTTIHILNASSLAPRQLERIVSAAGQIFAFPAGMDAGKIDIGRAFDGSRGQYNSSALLAQLLSGGIQNGEKRIAVVDVDLYIPVLTFVFGEAQFSGPAAVVSTHRLANQFYGMPQNDDLFLDRIVKEVVHELGHTFGLYHCRQYDCVMHSSTYVEEIDLKQAALCEACKNVFDLTVT